ncbi:uncharacterized protein LAESUDRAFT_733138 [Laetiporus sulphureus 93-53]|uniref:Uncharacterized protein n=1 Tax=Laetiporus sulphureus 93-53 TaxID=1314785 RepID=A0A165ANJ1_9APHY|nr:uncharacterized protein LAESUDRAFT_733138 [Laetiporus sulphureus 93-53]KZS99351.1 hypothetical protein LAESUDRAFT_733138 [Laetiporus sulphureus 93-53]
MAWHGVAWLLYQIGTAVPDRASWVHLTLVSLLLIPHYFHAPLKLSSCQYGEPQILQFAESIETLGPCICKNEPIDEANMRWKTCVKLCS